MKSIELLIILMALNSSSATASHDNQARADGDSSPPAKTVAAKAANRTAPTSKNSVYKLASRTNHRQTQTPLNPDEKLASTPRAPADLIE